MTPRLRYALIAVSLLGISAALVQYRSWSVEQARLADLLERADAARTMPGLAEQVRRANDPIEARMAATRPLVAQYLDPTWLFDVPEEERLDAWERSLAALEKIHALATDSMSRQPTSWQAPMVYGASTYMLARGNNLGVSTARLEEWEAPLRHAESLIPNYLEPTKYLAVAYINHWQSLSSEQRKRAEVTLSKAFEDQRTFNLTIELWLRFVPDRGAALALIPDQPHAWKRLERIFLRKADWDLYLESRARFRQAEGRRIDDMLDEADARVAGGDYRKGTSQFHQAAGALEPRMENLARLQRILERMPAGPVGRAANRSLRSWLDWTLALGFVRQSPLEPEQLRRLAGAVPDTRLHESALVGLLVGDLAEAERTERHHQGPFDEAWGRYLILKADALLQRRELEEARTSLLRVRGSWESHLTYLRVRAALARAMGDQSTVERVESDLEEIAGKRWRGHQMRWSGGTARLVLLPETSANRISVEFLEAYDPGQPIEVYWNGESLGTRIAYPGESVLLDAPVLPEASLLELRAADRRPFVPGLITLIGSES